MTDALVLIPARGGSKGIPKKNIKPLEGKPLIQYSIDFALSFTRPENICVSTDDDEIIEVAQRCGIHVPFKRPEDLATDSAGSHGVILHALQFYEERGRKFGKVILLQPTSPFRNLDDLHAMDRMYSPEVDMVVSVGKPHHNPYFSLFEENEEGFLELSKKGHFSRRQDCPDVYFYNGSIYIINPDSVRVKPLNQFTRVRKYLMDDLYSVDIDSPLDWMICETLLRNKLL